MTEPTNGAGRDAHEPAPSLNPPAARPRKHRFLSGLRSSFIAGVVAAAPLAITISIIYWFLTGPMRKLDRFVRSLLPAGDSALETITQAMPGFGVLVALVAIVLLGAFTKNFAGRALIRTGEKFLDRMPVIRNLYRFFKNVFETALQKSARSFKEVGIIEYPRKGLYALAFIVSDNTGEVGYALRGSTEALTGVFVPTVPNPTSGFLIYVPRAEIIPLKMSIEEAAKVVFSLGLVVPEFDGADDAVRKLEKMAEAAAQERRTLLSRLPGRKADS